MRSIVVPVNFTATSANAARYAADMALAIRAEVHLVYVLQMPVTFAEVPMPDVVFQEMQGNGYDLLKGLSEYLVRRTGGKVAIATDLEIGGVDQKVKQFCNWKTPFFVVMGASGHSLENTLEGSHAANSVRHLSYPVLVVPENARFQPIRKVIVACDRDDIDSGMPASLPFLKELSDLFGSRFEVVHILTNIDEAAGEAILEYNEWKGNLKAFGSELHLVRTADVTKGIEEYLGEHKGDWLMVFPKKHGLLEFHRSHSKQLALNCAIPVISLHE